jgi:SAM-dependent methyltransferase
MIRCVDQHRTLCRSARSLRRAAPAPGTQSTCPRTCWTKGRFDGARRRLRFRKAFASRGWRNPAAGSWASTRARISSRKQKPGPHKRTSRSTSGSGDAESLPFADAAFDVTRAERLLVYVPDPKRVLEEMRRVTRPGGVVTAIEPDFGTNAINLADRDLVRRVLTTNATPTFRMAGWCATCAGPWRTASATLQSTHAGAGGSLFHRDGQDGAGRRRDRPGGVRPLGRGDRGLAAARPAVLQRRLLPVTARVRPKRP